MAKAKNGNPYPPSEEAALRFLQEIYPELKIVQLDAYEVKPCLGEGGSVTGRIHFSKTGPEHGNATAEVNFFKGGMGARITINRTRYKAP